MIIERNVYNQIDEASLMIRTKKLGVNGVEITSNGIFIMVKWAWGQAGQRRPDKTGLGDIRSAQGQPKIAADLARMPGHEITTYMAARSSQPVVIDAA